MSSNSSSAPSPPPALETILRSTTSQDPRIRADAEQKLQSIDASVLCGFLAILTVDFHTKKDSSSRLLALSHLEKAAHRFECTEFFRSIIENFLRNENEAAARQWPLLRRDELVSSAVDLEATARYFCRRFLPFILKSFDSSSEATQQEIALLLLHKLVQFDHITRLVLDSMADRLCERLKLFFLGAEEISLKVRIAAVQASFSCILHILNNENEGVFQLLLAQVMNTVFSDGELAFENGEQDYALAVLFRLIDVARRKAEFLQYQSEILIQFALKYAESGHSNGRLGIELVVLLAEGSRKYHQKVLPVVIKALNDFLNPEIQLPAARAVGCFIQTSPSNILALHINEIVTPILGCIEKGDANLKMAAMGALTSVAKSSSKDQFQPHYRNALHQLEAALRGAAADKSDHLLVAASIECISTVCLAVGKVTCGGDIPMVVQWLVSALESAPVLEDPIRIQVLQAWGRLCKCLGHGFQPYLESAMPPLLQSSKFDPYVISNDEDCQTGQSDKSIKVIEPMVLERMGTACKVLYACVVEIREGLGSWTDKVAEALIPILKFKKIEDVAFAAVLALLVILQSSYKVAIGKSDLPQRLESPFQEASLSKIRAKILDSLDEYLKLCDKNSSIFLRPYVDELVNVIMEVRSGSKDKADEEQEVYEKAGKCLVTFIKASTPSLEQFVDKLLAYIPQLLDKTDEERKIALHIFCDLAEQCQGKADWYCKTNLPILFRASGNESPEVQQLVAKAIGISARFGGSSFEHVLGGALSSLNTIMGDPRALPQDYLPAHVAAVSALEEILVFQLDKLIAAEKVVNSWQNYVRIEGDINEARVVHDQLLSMFRKLDVRTCFRRHINVIMSILSEVMHFDY